MDASLQTAIWGSLLLGAGSLVAVIKFWMQRGRAEAGAQAAAAAAVEAAQSAKRLAETAFAKAELLAAQCADDRVEAAPSFATIAALADVERRVAVAMEGMRDDLRRIADRLDRVTDHRLET